MHQTQLGPLGEVAVNFVRWTSIYALKPIFIGLCNGATTAAKSRMFVPWWGATRTLKWTAMTRPI